MRYCLVLLVLLILAGCSPRVRTVLNDVSRPALPADAHVVILDENTPAPKGTLLLGSISIGDTGFSAGCSFDKVLEIATARARQLGGNLVKLTRLTPPDEHSTCFRIEADLLSAADLPALATAVAREKDARQASYLLAGTPYALLYLYCPASPENLKAYDVLVDKRVLYRANRHTMRVLKINRAGTYTIRPDSPTAEPLTLTMEPGQEYFVRCDAQPGRDDRPVLTKMKNTEGRQQTSTIPWTGGGI
ncbi:DUF2846 domain-containing protein [Hymenobacter sp. BT175]|uniref:DUF2846 domain-containing protein n=1 Tax=Hymenobacter translucens TaxID=2886507 RepID=UPI001D0DF2AA|nr:DUF2846 domain-containing protein [Hymenobacter translucens]MCC2547378.1 DUF2846 domain-containing protein [Hymenobacter translucens]